MQAAQKVKKEYNRNRIRNRKEYDNGIQKRNR